MQHVSIGIAVLLLASACEPASPDVVVRFVPPLSSSDAVRVEVSLLPTCEGQALGDPPSAPLATPVDITQVRSRPLGVFDQGDYGLYGRAFDASCAVVAAGCAPVTVGDGDLLEVGLSPLSGPGCEADERCGAEGTCTAARAPADGAAPDGGG